MIIRTKSVNDRCANVKGVIITAESLRDLYKWLGEHEGCAETRRGARQVIDLLDNIYDKVR